MLGNTMAALNRKILRLYVKLGDTLGLWSSNDQVTLNIEGVTTRRLYAEWTIPTEEYENE
jgi:hypothetical protein